MYPHERSLVKKMQNKSFALLGVNTDQDRDALKPILTKEKITWRSFWNGGSTNGPITKKYKIQGFPSLFLIDAKGVIRHVYVGGPNADALDKAIEKLLKEASADAKN
jgi:cytochrome oxidase Cu insertion factor (SCO1/SenC/PrrC family)